MEINYIDKPISNGNFYRVFFPKKEVTPSYLELFPIKTVGFSNSINHTHLLELHVLSWDEAVRVFYKNPLFLGDLCCL